MKIELVDIGKLVLDPANARRHPERNLSAIKGSLARFGQQKPIVANAAGVVIAGNGTLEAAKELGWDKIAVVRSELGGTDLAAFAIADNRSSELAEWDRDVLGSILHALREDSFDLTSIGFDTSYLDTFNLGDDLSDSDKQTEWDKAGMPDYEGLDPCFRKIIVSFDRAQDVEAFFKLLGQSYTESTKSVWFPKKEQRDLESLRWDEDAEAAQ
jgi:ParB-like nuclease domain